MNTNILEHICDEQLVAQVKTAAVSERRATVHLIVLLGEFDRRQLYLAEGYSSLFTYCTQCLHLSEHAAYGRIEAARVARRCPLVLEFLQDASITLTTVCLLASHLTSENSRQLLEAARHRSKREVEQQVAALTPKPDVPSRVQKLPATTVATVPPLIVQSTNSDVADAVDALPTAQVRRPVIAPLTPERYKVQITISRETHDSCDAFRT